MGQANNSGRNASLDEHKRRAAGRSRQPGDLPTEPPQVKGAFGKDSRPNTTGRRASNLSRGAGGGGGARTLPKDIPMDVQNPGQTGSKSRAKGLSRGASKASKPPKR